MNRCYVTCHEEGLPLAARLVQDAALTHGFATRYVDKFAGAVAMMPKLVLQPSLSRDLNTLEKVLNFVGDSWLYVYELRGENCDAVVQQMRNAAGLKTYNKSRVHVTRSPAEMAIVEFAQFNDSLTTAEHIRTHYTLADMV